MKWISSYNSSNKKYIIEREDFRTNNSSDIYYQFTFSVWQKNKCIDHDHQDTFEWAITVALEDYGVPKDSWKKVE